MHDANRFFYKAEFLRVPSITRIYNMRDLPTELVVSIARNFACAAPLLGMLATCRGWRAAIQTAHAELWMLVTRRRFPRVARLCELMRKDHDYNSIQWRWTERIACVNDDLDARAMYAAQLRAEKPIKHQRRAYHLPFLNDFIFTVEMLDTDGKPVCSWSGVFEGDDSFEDSFGNHRSPDCGVSNFPVPEQPPAWFRAVHQGGGGGEVDGEVPRWSLQIFLTSRSDMASTTKLYDESWIDVDEGPMVYFDSADLPVNHPSYHSIRDGYIELRPHLEYVSGETDGMHLQLIFTYLSADRTFDEAASEAEVISALMSCLPSHVYY